MLTELKRCNSIGNLPGIVFLVHMISGRSAISFSEAANRCALEYGINVNCKGAFAFFEYLGYVKNEDENILISSDIECLRESSDDEIIAEIVRRCLKILTDEGVFDADAFCFDSESGHLEIKKSAFPLAYAAIRNFLITAGVLDREDNGEIGITEAYEENFAKHIRERRRKISIEQLLQQQEEKNKRGLEAEEFVLHYEQSRIPMLAYKIKRISDIDVSAGYDIASFSDSSSENYDRFVEVKCYLGTPHFYWSENEVDTAKIKGNRYYLCLVDYSKISTPGYSPEYICDPYNEIFNNEGWLVNTSSYKIQKI